VFSINFLPFFFTLDICRVFFPPCRNNQHQRWKLHPESFRPQGVNPPFLFYSFRLKVQTRNLRVERCELELAFHDALEPSAPFLPLFSFPFCFCCFFFLIYSSYVPCARSLQSILKKAISSPPPCWYASNIPFFPRDPFPHPGLFALSPPIPAMESDFFGVV